MNPLVVLETTWPGVPVRRGKVRDVYDLGDELLIVATDRISAFDVVMASGIPDKGRILTALSVFWFQRFSDRIAHHLLSTAVDIVPDALRSQFAGRSMRCRKAEVVPIECVVRGYLAGSGWKEYGATGAVCGVKLPAGLRQCEKLPQPIFTPATKASEGHDENISFERACELVGAGVMRELRDTSLMLYRAAAEYAAGRGIIIADTKFEFGSVSPRGSGGPQLILIDEVLTPDSSRFWPADRYEPGRDQESFDKQFVRNYLETLVAAGRWDKRPPGPVLPTEVIEGTRQRYVEAYERLTGREFGG
jgi:phosphoribosylaminoimidazole-succinocarboxamide synthase